MEKISRRGRPKLSRETVQERLREYGWEIPEGIKYRGANEIHTVQCTSCRYITEKILHNVVYRKEVCPHTESHSELIMTRDIPGEVMVYNDSNIPALVDRVVAKHIDSIKEDMKEQNELILNTAINREGLLEKFNKLIAATISRRGYITFNREMTAEEWFDASDIVARDLIKRLDEPGDTELLKNYEYHRSKSSNKARKSTTNDNEQETTV
ncbi:hypothetical protein GNF82_14330 [Clostridium perfringens]